VPLLSLSLADEGATARLGAALAHRVRPGDVIALKGGLGAGKTALARALLRAASGAPELAVPSPTFTLVELYDTPTGPIRHFDLYRLRDADEVAELGWDEARAEGAILVEWPERLGATLPANTLTIELAQGASADARVATLDLAGDWAARLADLAAHV